MKKLLLIFWTIALVLGMLIMGALPAHAAPFKVQNPAKKIVLKATTISYPINQNLYDIWGSSSNDIFAVGGTVISIIMVLPGMLWRNQHRQASYIGYGAVQAMMFTHSG